jgi:hypothetical protein
MAPGKHMKRAFDVALIVTLIAGAWRFVLPVAAEAPPPPPLTIGSRLELPKVRWQSQRRHFVFIMDTGCSACEKAVPAARRLAAAVASHSTEIDALVLSDEPIDAVKGWLGKQSIPISNVSRASIAKLGVLFTPSLLILDHNGVVTDFVDGAPSEPQEAALRARIESAASPPVAGQLPSREVSDDENMSGRYAAGLINLIDIRERDEAGRTDALVIPEDELTQRAQAELAQSKPTVIDCRQTGVLKCRIAANTLNGLGFQNVIIRVPSRGWLARWWPSLTS